MLGSIIRYLLDNKLTSLKELEEVTGHGTSTLYRWMNGESEPHFTDMQLLIRQLKPEARRALVGMITSDLPIVVNWLTDDEGLKAEDESGKRHDGHEVLERTILALDCVTHAISEEHDAIRNQTLPRRAYGDLVRLMNDAIRHLTASKNMLEKYVTEEPDGGAT